MVVVGLHTVQTNFIDNISIDLCWSKWLEISTAWSKGCQ